MNRIQRETLRTIGFLLILSIFVLSVISCESTEEDKPSMPKSTVTTEEERPPTPKPTVITKDASELILGVQSLPVGWTLWGEETTSEGYLVRTFVHIDDYGFKTVMFPSVKIFQSIDEAKIEYADKLAEVQEKHSTSDPNIGDESFAYTHLTHRCLFRKRNVIGIVDMSWAALGGSLDKTIEWARELEKRIF